MRLGETQEFASPGEALAHYGVKGMKWGVRKEDVTFDTSTSGGKAPKTDAERKAIRRARAKKVAIGTGILVAAAGAGFVAYKLHQNGNLSLSQMRKASKTQTAATKKIVDKVFHDQTDVIHVARGKNVGYGFLRKGGIPNYYQEAEKYLADPVDGAFNPLPDGRIVARLLDPAGRKDFAGRPIGHDMIIPKSMAASIHNMDDVEKHIWPKLKLAYDAYYTAKDRRM